MAYDESHRRKTYISDGTKGVVPNGNYEIINGDTTYIIPDIEPDEPETETDVPETEPQRTQSSGLSTGARVLQIPIAYISPQTHVGLIVGLMVLSWAKQLTVR